MLTTGQAGSATIAPNRATSELFRTARATLIVLLALT
jgi:hypothetical protein